MDLFGFPGYLLVQAFGLLLFAAGQYAHLLLHFTNKVFYHPFDLLACWQIGLHPQETKIERNVDDGLYGSEPIRTVCA